jgi:hypothetical protein
MTFRQVNKELLSAMEVSTEVIGKVFLELAPYLKFYSTYANDFEKATKLVEEWTEKHKVRKQEICGMNINEHTWQLV